MNIRALGVYREPEFSPGKVGDDAAVLDAALAELARTGAVVSTIAASEFPAARIGDVDLVLAMCQGERALGKLAALEQNGAVALNSALAIRNCYRDLLCAGLMNAGVPVPAGGLIRTALPLELAPIVSLDFAAALYVKRGDLHALGPDDVQRAEGEAAFDAALAAFRARGIESAYVQQAVEGTVVKFYGVSGGEFFSVLSEGAVAEGGVGRKLALDAAAGAAALGLEVWGGDAIVDGDRAVIVDFNDWPSYSRVREQAGRAIARRSRALLRRARRAA